MQLSKWSRSISSMNTFNYKVHRKWMKAQHNLNKFIIYLKFQMMSILWIKSNLHNYTFLLSLSALEKIYCYSLSPKQTIKNVIFPTKSITHFLLIFILGNNLFRNVTIKCTKYQLSLQVQCTYIIILLSFIKSDTLIFMLIPYKMLITVIFQIMGFD